MFTTNFDVTNLSMFLALKIIKFEDVFSTKIIHFQVVIKEHRCAMYMKQNQVIVCVGVCKYHTMRNLV